MDPGNDVMADKDFNIQDDFAAIGVTVNVHSFLKKNSVQQRRNGTQQENCWSKNTCGELY